MRRFDRRVRRPRRTTRDIYCRNIHFIRSRTPLCHCEERSDVAIQTRTKVTFRQTWIATHPADARNDTIYKDIKQAEFSCNLFHASGTPRTAFPTGKTNRVRYPVGCGIRCRTDAMLVAGICCLSFRALPCVIARSEATWQSGRKQKLLLSNMDCHASCGCSQ